MDQLYPIQSMRWSPNKHFRLISFAAVVCIFLAALLLWTWLASLPFLVIGIAWWHMTFRIRCPQCSRRMRAREVPLDDDRKQLFFDCAHCHITWDPTYIWRPSP